MHAPLPSYVLIKPRETTKRYSMARQHDDGSWAYGEADTYQEIDNFHTGYDVCAL
jgi:hypothetical protein